MDIVPLNPPDEEDDPLYAEARIRLLLSNFLKREYWSLLDACLLVHLIDPTDPSLQLISEDEDEGYYLPRRVEKLFVILQADAGTNLKCSVKNGGHRVRPADFSEWLNWRGFVPPKIFSDTVSAAEKSRASTARQLRTRKTQEKYKLWNEMYAELLGKNKNLSKNRAAKLIEKELVSRGVSLKGNDSETIRKHLSRPKKKVGR